MTCGSLSEGLELHFLESGVRIQPIEGQISEKIREYKTATFEVTQEAGLVIKNNALEAEPVEIKIGGNKAHRMYFPANAVTMRHDLQRDDIAVVELHDALNVFERGIISKKWNAATLTTVVNHMMEHRDDPYEVITGVRFTDDDLKNQMSAKLQDTLNVTGTSDPLDSLESAYEFLEFSADNMVASFDFQDANLLNAFIKVIDTFEVDAWVNFEGVLLIGTYPAWGEVIGILEKSDLPKLANYTITESSAQTEKVVVEGPFRGTEDGFIDDAIFSALDAAGGGAADEIITSLNVKAVAERTDISGKTVSLDFKNIESMAAAENAAGRGLVGRTMDEVSGTIEFDGYVHPASEQETLSKLSIGDYIVVDSIVPNECETKSIEFRGGTFLTQHVTQRFNSREGWRVICEVSETVTPDITNLRSWLYDPRTGERYEEDPIYGEEFDLIEAIQSLSSEVE